jgi:uncharacterized membrane protein
MEVFIFFLCLGIFVTAVIMPWVNFYRHGDLADDVKLLRLEMRNLRKIVDEAKASPALAQNLPPEEIPPASVPLVKAAVLQAEAPDVVYGEFEEFARTPAQKAAVQKVKAQSQKAASGSFYQRFEENIGARLPVWVGGIALIFAAFYLVKYSIDAGLLGPAARLMLGGLFGFFLLAGGHMVSRRGDGASLLRITQALIGAGLVVLYICLYAATNIHEFLSPLAGFIGMGLVTGIGVIMSLRHGQPVAAFALIGGLLTPVLIQTDAPNPLALFGYLFVLFAGLMFVMSSMGWWLMALFALFGMYGWAALWLLFLIGETDSSGSVLFFVLGLVLACLVFTQNFVRQSSARTEKLSEKPDWGFGFSMQHVINLAAIAGGFMLVALINFKLTLQPFDWGVMALMSASLIALSFFRPDIYAVPLWFKTAASLGLFAFWCIGQPIGDQLTVLGGLSFVYILLPQFLLRKTHDPRLWAMMQSICAPVLLIIAYWHIDISAPMQAMFADRFWGISGLALSVLAALQARMVSDGYKADPKIRDHLIGAYALASTAFLSLSIVFEIPYDYMPLAFAMQIVAVAWVAKTIKLEALQKIVAILLLVFAGLNFKQILLFFGLFLQSIFAEPLSLKLANATVLDQPLLLLGGSAGFLLVAVWLNHTGSVWSKRTTNMLLAAVITLLAAALYYALKTGFEYNPPGFAMTADFMMRGMITIAFAVFALALITASKILPYDISRQFGVMMFHAVMLRIFWFDMLIFNPFFDSSQDVMAAPLLNGVTLTYGLVALLSLVFLKRYLIPQGAAKSIKIYSIWSLVLVFAFVNFSIRQYFQGGILAAGTVGETEIYIYSVAWLMLGIALLFLGTKYRSQPVRVASLAVMILTVGKVFLYDAGELEGLFRVFSFLGLGFSLIGLSFFYTRFVFAKSGAAKT